MVTQMQLHWVSEMWIPEICCFVVEGTDKIA
jgi:hypothetical protein